MYLDDWALADVTADDWHKALSTARHLLSRRRRAHSNANTFVESEQTSLANGRHGLVLIEGVTIEFVPSGQTETVPAVQTRTAKPSQPSDQIPAVVWH